MPRTSYVYCEKQKRMVEKSEYYEREERGPFIRGDIEPFVSPIDGTVIGSRSDLRSHMRKHDVVPTAEVSSEWSAAERRRRDIREGRADKHARIAALSDAFEHVRNQRRARAH